jgi:hypothetical protein
MGSSATACGQLEHLWAERGDDALVLGHAVLIELGEVFSERVVGLPVFGDQLGMSCPDTEQESPGVGRLDAVKRLGDLTGGRRPDVDDARCDLQVLGEVKDWLNPVEFGRRRAACPDCAVAERLDFPQLCGSHLLPLLKEGQILRSSP